MIPLAASTLVHALLAVCAYGVISLAAGLVAGRWLASPDPQEEDPTDARRTRK